MCFLRTFFLFIIFPFRCWLLTKVRHKLGLRKKQQPPHKHTTAADSLDDVSLESAMMRTSKNTYTILSFDITSTKSVEGNLSKEYSMLSALKSTHSLYIHSPSYEILARVQKIRPSDSPKPLLLNFFLFPLSSLCCYVPCRLSIPV